MPDEPLSTPTAPPVLRGLSARRERWRAEREARLSLFIRPTPGADRLLVVARVRLGARRITWTLGGMLGVHALWRLSGLELSHPAYQWLDALLGPVFRFLRTYAPDQPTLDASALILQHVEVLLCVVGLELAAVWALRAWLYPALLPLAVATQAPAEPAPADLEEEPPLPDAPPPQLSPDPQRPVRSSRKP